MATNTNYLQALTLVVNQQISIEAVIGIAPADRVIGNINSNQIVLPVNNITRNQTKINYVTDNITSFHVDQKDSYSKLGKTVQTFQGAGVNVPPPKRNLDYANFNNNVALNFGGLTFTSTNYSGALYTSPGQYTWTVPAGVTRVNIAAIGGGGGGSQKITGGSGGGGGLLDYANSLTVVPGTTYNISVGQGGTPALGVGNYGSSTYVVRSTTGAPVIYAAGGAGGDSLFWKNPDQLMVGEDITGAFSDQGAFDPANKPITYSVVAGSLPPNMTLNTQTGVLSWTETTTATTGLSNTSTVYPAFYLSAQTDSQTITRPVFVNVQTNPIDPFYTATNMILSFNNTGTLFNSDNSIYNRQLAVAGSTAQPINFSPFNGNYYSAYFDNSTGYINVSTGTNLEFGGNAFTVEFWWCPTNTARQWFYHSSSDYWFGIDYNSVGTFRMGLWASSNGTSWNLINADAAGNGIANAPVYPVIGRWNHVAVSRNAGNYAMWLNGSQVLKLTGIAGNIISRLGEPKRIGAHANAAYKVSGWMSNFRVINGAALYDPTVVGNITVPTAPLDNSIGSSVSLLTLQGNQYRDNSQVWTTATVTATGVVSVVPYNPFMPTPDSYTTASIYNSGYFSANGDAVFVPQQGSPLIGKYNSDFTVEAWVYPISRASTNPTVFANYVNSAYNGGLGIFAGHSNETSRWAVLLDNGIAPAIQSPQLVSDSIIAYNQWNHVAVTRIGTTTTLYVNGLAERYISTSTPYQVSGSGQHATIGTAWEQNSTYFNGYISNVRTVDGVGVYNIPQPSTPSLAFNGSNYIQLFTGTNAAVNSAFTFDSGNFTVECWVRFGEVSTQFQGIIGSQDFNFVAIQLNEAVNQKITVWLPNTANSAWALTLTSNTTFQANRWYHLAVVKNSTTVSFYVDGTLDTSGAHSTALGAPMTSVAIGRSQLVARMMRGWISNVRIVKGVAVYTGNFTRPTGPLTAIQSANPFGGSNTGAITAGQTSLLTAQDAWFKDNSSYNWNFSIIAANNVPGFSSQNPYVANTASFALPNVLATTQTAGTFTNAITATTSTTLLTLKNFGAIHNGTFVDNSIYKNTVVRFGSASQGSPNPFRLLTSSTYFNGSSYISTSTASPAFGFGTGDWTIECWVLPTSNPANGPGTICDLRTGATASATTIQVNNARQLNIYNGPGNTSYTLNYGPLVTMGVWNHIAVTRIGGTMSGYINGQLAGQGTGATGDFGTSQPCMIGNNQTAGYNWNGLISNFRVVKGFGLYTGPFTPASSPLNTTQTARTNVLPLSTGTYTTLLTLQQSYTDRSSYNHIIGTTYGGTPTTDWQTPFVTTSTYVPYTLSQGGSGYFSGSSDYLQINNNYTLVAAASTLTNSTSSWTVECWLKPSGDYSTYRTVFAKRVNAAATTSFEGYLRLTSGVISYYNGTNYESTYTLQPGVWSHCAWVYDGANMRIYVNGILRYTTALASITEVDQPLVIGGARGNTEWYQGWLSDFRMVKGIAVYTTSSASLGNTCFIPPTSQLTTTEASRYGVTEVPSSTFTSVLINFDNAGIYDSTTKNSIITVGNAQLTTSTYKYGNGGLYFPYITGITNWYPIDYIRTPLTATPGTPGSNILAADFTVEYWFNSNGFKNAPGANHAYTWYDLHYECRTATGASTGFGTVTDYLGRLAFFNNNAFQIYSDIQCLPGQWYHVAVVRFNGVIRLYLNGAQQGNPYANTTVFTDNQCMLGISYGDSLQVYDGYFDELRVTKLARYTANFIPPYRFKAK